MEKETKDNLPVVTMEELVRMVNESTNEFVIHMELGEERDSGERKESVQT